MINDHSSRREFLLGSLSGCSLTRDSNTHVEIGAGDRMLRKALTRVYEMLGKFRDVPDRD